jgi:hypothetical protein
VAYWRDKNHWLAVFAAAILSEAYRQLADEIWPAQIPDADRVECDLSRMTSGYMIDLMFDFDDQLADAYRKAARG